MMQPQRRCVPLGSIIKLSVGRRGLNTLQTERGRDVQPHMHLLTTSYFHSHEWGPHTDSPHCRQTVRAKTFHNTSSIQCWEKLFLGLHRAEPSGRSVFRLQEHRALQRERETGCFFSEIWRAVSYYPQSFMWSKGLFIPFFLQNCLLQNWFYFCFFRLLLCYDEHSKTLVGLSVMEIGALISLIVLK